MIRRGENEDEVKLSGQVPSRTASFCSSGPGSSSAATGESTRFDGVLEVLARVYAVRHGSLVLQASWRELMNGRTLTCLMEMAAWWGHVSHDRLE